MKIFITIIISLLIGFIVSRILAWRKPKTKILSISHKDKQEVKKIAEEKMKEIKEELKTEVNEVKRNEIINDIDDYFDTYYPDGYDGG